MGFGVGKSMPVMRDITKHPKALEAGMTKLVSTNCDKIVCEILALRTDTVTYGHMSHAVNPYGDGKFAIA